MFKNFLIKKMLSKQGIPEVQINAFIKMMEKDPKLFETIATEIGERVKRGEDQTSAGMEVMKKYEVELRGLI